LLWLWTLGRKFELKRLTDFLEVETCNVDIGQFRIDYFLIRCPKCKSEKVILKGWRKNKRKGPVRRFCCKICGHKFSQSIHGHFPLKIIEFIFDLAVKGSTPGDIADSIAKTYSINISRQTIMNVIEKYLEKFLEFEVKLRHKLESKEWQIDDTPQIFPKDNSNTKGKKSRFIWITNVLAVDSRYWLSANISNNRSAEESNKAFTMAVKRAKYAPIKVRCDGYEGHIKGIRSAYPFIYIDSASKKEDFGHINLIESLHSFIRRKGVKKRGRFRSIENLQCFVELLRIYYNFLHPHSALDTTPAAKAGIAPPFKCWGEFIRYVHRLSE